MSRPFAVAMLAALAVLPSSPLRAQLAGEIPAAEAAAQAATVRGLAADDELNIRATASPTGIVLGRLRNGSAVLRHECGDFNDYEWCRVESADFAGLAGWAPGRYLRVAGEKPPPAAEFDEAEAAIDLPLVMEPPPGAPAPAPAEMVEAAPQAADAAQVAAASAAPAVAPAGPEPDLTRTVLLAGLAAREGAAADQILAFDGRHEIAATDAAGHALALAFASRDIGTAEIYALADPAAAPLDRQTEAASDASPPVAEAQASDDASADTEPPGEAAAPVAIGIPVPTPRPDRGEEPADEAALVASVEPPDDDAETEPPAAVPVQSPVVEPPEAAAPVPAPPAAAAPLTAPPVAEDENAVVEPPLLAALGLALPLTPDPGPADGETPPPISVAPVPAAPATMAAEPLVDPLTVAQTQSLPAPASFDATAEIPCARYLGQPMTRCEAGAARLGDGSADVTVTWPDGGTRTIRFREGRPEGANSRGEFRFTREADLNMIRIGPSERFEITDALPFGE